MAICVAVLLALGVGAVVKVGGHHDRVQGAAGSRRSTPGAGSDARGKAGITVTPGLAPAETTTTTVAPTTSTSQAGAATTAPSTTSPTTTMPRSGGHPTPTTTPPRPKAGLTPAANGTYTYAVVGSEGATGAGNRAFPATMTISVHGGAGVDPATARVFDLTLSPTHSEQQVVQWGPSGVTWTFESGMVQFGTVVQQVQDTYAPPMLQIPSDLTPGTTVSGASSELAGSTKERVENWTAKVLGPQTLTLAGQAIPTVMVQVVRSTPAGTPETIHRTTTFWYSPATHMVVKYAEALVGSQTLLGSTFTYTETLVSVTLVHYSAL